MKKYLTELADYNIWANNLVCEWLEQINEEQYLQVLGGSFGNIQTTTLHIAGAEKIWFERLQGTVEEWLMSAFKGDKTMLLDIWKKSSQNLKQLIEDLPEEEFTEKFAFKSRDGVPSFMEKYKALAHTFNHSSYHRGQIVNYLRQVGFTEITSTDLIGYYRKID